VSLRYFSKALTVPNEARFKILALLQSPIFFVRVQALKVTPLLGERVALEAAYKALADENWWVRKRAATVLHSLDRTGIEALEYAREHHYDPFGRDTAANELLEVELEQSSHKSGQILL
jgi:HEAT repeat protein